MGLVGLNLGAFGAEAGEATVVGGNPSPRLRANLGGRWGDQRITHVPALTSVLLSANLSPRSPLPGHSQFLFPLPLLFFIIFLIKKNKDDASCS